MNIELNNLIEWTTGVERWMNNWIEWIFEIRYWIEYWIESFLGPIQCLNESSKSIEHPYPKQKHTPTHINQRLIMTMMVYDDCLWFMMISDHSWWFVIINDVLWWSMAICDDLWRFVIICDDLWWFMMIFDDFNKLKFHTQSTRRNSCAGNSSTTR